MKKFKCSIFSEFKAFITRGNVIDLAVGMIIGAAFTAIVTALVNGIFKPLINAIPMGDISGLITMLVPAYDAEGAIDLTKSVYINWGDFIMAIINFLITAVVLFAIIKAINTFRGGVNELGNTYGLTRAEMKELKAQGMSRKEIKAHVEKQKAEAEAAAAAEAAKNAPETTDQILKDIRELLKSLRPAQAEAISQKVDEVVGEESAN